MNTNSNADAARQAHGLLTAGMLLFLAGLLTGAIVPAFANCRMGLTAHLAGVQDAMFLLILGTIWPRIAMTFRRSRAAWALNVSGMYGIWLSLVLAAVLGTSRATPIAGAGFQASAAEEAIVQALIGLSSAAAMAGAATLVHSLWQTRLAIPDQPEPIHQEKRT